MPISFDNFPLPVKNEKMIRHYKCISLLRRTEIAALRYKYSPNDPNGLPISPMKDGSLDGSRYLSSRSNSLVQLTATETENEILVKDDLSLLYDPFQIVTANRKITQLLVVQNLVYEELNKFNLTFEDLLIKKQNHNRECINQLLRLYNSVAKRVKPQIENCPNPFRQYISQPYVFKDDLTDVMNNRPSSLADGPWKNFIEYCERKIQFSRDAAEKANIANEMKLRLRDFENEMNRIEDSLREMKDDKSILTDELLNTLVDMHIPFTFRQGQVEIPSDIVLINYDDVVLIDKKVVIDRNKLILEAGQKKLDELENIKKQHTNHRMLKWEIDKSRVDLTNLEEQFKEYQLFRVKKEDMLLIQGGERNKNQDLVNQLNKGLDHMQRTHAIRLARAKQDLKKLKRKVNLKKKENDKIEDDILKMQLELKERKRIYNIQMISSKGAAEARKNRLKQVMMISKLKRAKQIQDEKITILNDEIIKLRKCVYTTFNDGEDIGGMVGYT